MALADPLRQEWRERNALQPIHRGMTIADAGIVLGAGTVLVPTEGRFAKGGGSELGGKERLLALLSAFYGEPVRPEVLGNILRASEYSRDGERCLASIALARTRLPAITNEEEACWRLHVADRLIAGGVAPRDAVEAMGIDPAPIDALKAGFNVLEPRIPPGNALESGRWTYGDGVTIIPVAARSLASQSGDPDEFFDTLYEPVHALAQRSGIDETWLLGLAAYESSWLYPHDRELNDPFGVTHGGGPNLRYTSIADAVAYWEKKFSSVVRGAKNPADFAQRLWEKNYNTRNSRWRSELVQTIDSIPAHLKSWRFKREP